MIGLDAVMSTRFSPGWPERDRLCGCPPAFPKILDHR
jgi:hypothetical protein